MKKYNPWLDIHFYKKLISGFIPALKAARRAYEYGNGSSYFENFMWYWTCDPSWVQSKSRKKRKQTAIKRKILFITIVSLLFIFIFGLCGCSNTPPVAQVPTYNVTLTDNSQYIVGDNNAADTKATTATEQAAEPDVSAKAEKTSNSMFLFWLGFVIGLVICFSGYFVYVRYFKKK